MSTTNQPDPRLTAYLHGELTEAESAALEAELAANPELQNELDALRQADEALADLFTNEVSEQLDAEDRDLILEVEDSRWPPLVLPRWLKILAPTAIAATLIFAFLINFEMLPGGALFKYRSDVSVVEWMPIEEEPSAAEQATEPQLELPPPTLKPSQSSSTEGTLFLSDASLSYGVAPDPETKDGYYLHGSESYAEITRNPIQSVKEHPLSTFSIDVDTASYANMRRFLNGGSLPPRDAVRIEELINYFTYAYEEPTDEHPFAAHMEIAECPWNMQRRLVRIGLKGRAVSNADRPATNVVFLLDVSGSMGSANKLGLVKESIKLLVESLRADDRLAIVVYAGASGLVLESTPGDNQQAIIGAINRLQSGGSTNGGAGIELAYKVASEHFIKGGANRVILCTDGDFNVGVTDRGDLTRLIEEKARTGVFLTVFGFGMGNYKDDTLERLANKGNGVYGYIDTMAEARKWLVEGLSGTLVTIAKDVKIQVEFNPEHVAGYRLIGYENLMLTKEDFNDDTKDAGEIGAGHTVTALYEIILPGDDVARPAVDPLKYQREPEPASSYSHDLLTLKLRYKQPDATRSTKLELPLIDDGRSYSTASADYKFAAAVAAFGMLLRDSPFKGTTSCDAVLELASEGLDHDPHGYRREFIQLVQKAKALSGQR